MKEWFMAQEPVTQAFAATCFTWFVTALGAALVFFFKEINKKFLDGMMGFAAGVMIAACFWSAMTTSRRAGKQTPAPRSIWTKYE